ncbi:hypothetical protein LWM68_26420 [Niabella sp. W65]|nr:hypothetical protein [Niabella sp. W65]MCH7365994.1 hypothetical protein [Niabella sp. W65]
MIANIISKKQKFYKEILKHLFFNKQLSCADLSNLIGKSIPLTTQYLSELISMKMVIEKGYAASTGAGALKPTVLKPVFLCGGGSYGPAGNPGSAYF